VRDGHQRRGARVSRQVPVALFAQRLREIRGVTPQVRGGSFEVVVEFRGRIYGVRFYVDSDGRAMNPTAQKPGGGGRKEMWGNRAQLVIACGCSAIEGVFR